MIMTTLPSPYMTMQMITSIRGLKQMMNDTHNYQVPRDAGHDDIILELEADVDGTYSSFATFFAIDRTLEPGTPVTMCVSFDNNEICEEEAIADYEHFYNSAMLEVDMNTTDD